MKTILPILLVLFLVSCSQPRPAPKFAEVEPAPIAPMAVAPPTVPAPAAVVELPPPTDFHEVTNQPSATAVEPDSSPVVKAPVVTSIPTIKPVPFAGETTPPVTGSTPGGDQMLAAGMIDFRNAPLDQVLTVYSELVNRTLLRPAALPTPQVTLTTRTALSKNEAIQALDAVLGMNGITMINVGDKFVKVVAQPQALTEGAKTDTRKADELPDFGPFVTHVVQLKYVKPSEIVPALAPFAKMNSILPIDASGILVLRDYTENIKRMLEMIERVDMVVPGEFISEVIPIKYAKASEIADALNSLSGGGGGGGTSIGRSAGGGTRPAVGNNPTGNRGAGGYGAGGMGQQNAGLGGMNPGGMGGAGAAGAGGGSSFTDRLRNIVSRAASTSGDLEILGKTKMIADERSNSLLIFATRSDMDMIKSVVAKLDVVLSQVLIETVIMDVNMGNTLNYGVTAGQNPNNFKRAGSSNTISGSVGGVYNNGGALGTLGDFFKKGLTNGAFPSSSGLTYFGRYRGDLDVAITAAATDSRVNVVQKPRILTSHATPGSIFVGSTVPYVTQTSYGGAYGNGNSYQQLQVGIGLTVTPFINPEGLVVMQIDETIDEISGSIPIAGIGDVPTTTSRKLSAEVAVNDGDTIILGGFIRNSSSKSDSGVPLLKDIPLLGALFSSKNNSKARNELIVLMRPTVLKTPEIAAMATTQEKKRLPGVSAAEAEVQEIEKAELEKERKRAAAVKRKADLEEQRKGKYMELDNPR